MRKFLSLLLVMCMACLLCTTGASAAGNDDDIDNQDVFNIRVPDGLDIYMDDSGRAGIVGNPAIENLGDRDVEITGIRVTGESGWDVLDFNNDFSGMSVNEKKLAMAFRGDGTGESGEVALSEGNWTVSGNSGLDLDAEAKMPAQDACEDTRIATVYWDFDWAGNTPEEPGENHPLVIPVLPGDGGSTSVGSVTTGDDRKIPIFPDVTADEGCVFDHWENQDGETVDGNTVFETGDEIKPVFRPNEEFECIPFTITKDNRSEVGFTGVENEDLVIPEKFQGSDGKYYVPVAIGELAFNQCKQLRSVVVPDTVTDIGAYAFCVCPALESVDLGDGVVTIGREAFDVAPKLVSIDIPDSCRTIEDMAFANSGLTAVSVPDTVTRIGTSLFYGCSSLKSAVLPGHIAAIPNSTFYGCTSLTDVDIPDGVVDIADAAFYGSGVTFTTLPGSVRTIGSGAFQACDMASFTVPESVVSMGRQCFSFCQNLKSIKFSSNCPVVPDSACLGCTRLSSVMLPNGITEIGDAAFQCKANMHGADGVMTGITLPQTLKTIGNNILYGQSIAFLNVPSGVTSIASGAFAGVTKIAYTGNASGGPVWGAGSRQS